MISSVLSYKLSVLSKKKNILFLLLLFLTAYSLQLTAYSCFAEELSNPSSGELIVKAWEAHGKRDTEATFRYTQECIDLYKGEADKQQAALGALPKNKEEIGQVAVLNDVATAYFIQAESLMRQEKIGEAKKIFQLIIDKYSYAQAWDQRGWYWQVAQAAGQSIKKIEIGSIEIDKKIKISQISTTITLYDTGKEDFVDYAKYGEFKNIGTKDYAYVIKDQEGLSQAVGEGIYPNTSSVRWDPEFKKAREEKRLEGNHWDFLHSPDLEAAFLKWATTSEPMGIKLFYTGIILEKAGLIKHAIKCYYAIVVHFPGSTGWTYWHTPWSVGQAAISKINFLLRTQSNLGYKLVDADIRIINGYDNDISNDIVITNPGRFEKVNFLEKFKPKTLPAGAKNIKRRLGEGKVHLVQYENGDWQLMVNNKPYIIKGITYAPTKVGESPDEGTMTNWMEDDFNQNGKIDGPYDAFVDKNRNNLQDANEPSVGDFYLMKEMGVNTIRLYQQPFKVNKELLRELYQNYGIMVIMGDFLGKYALGSGASWYPGTDYNNEEHRKNMLESVIKMVLEFKDEPYVLFWLLGNENVYGFACNANTEPDAFFKFANEVAKQIKAIDPEHPVAICSGDTLFLDKFGKNSCDIDIFGTNAYRGEYGFGFIWKQVKEEADKAVFITEFGCPAHAESKALDKAEFLQARYHQGAWGDIEHNMAFQHGAGNALGGVVFEWLDEWWKAYEPFLHDTKGLFTGPFPDGFMHEEWLGLSGQGDGKLSPFLRQLRQSYYTYKKLWRR
ncbi:MAG: glycoside hydrolase family 2 TIM barrel-domain containing protein [Candidatus Omnitrophica bacterium]|nr:glycoside hydrolase family 2 TIM barrel-domain containing protein [Candidatus Omnitrophota bacterium]MDD5592084.1 glycoside hydrolase family 2 TIM barrel-domain containing protein [Candidatus Omnitrophota bacterium]